MAIGSSGRSSRVLALFTGIFAAVIVGSAAFAQFVVPRITLQVADWLPTWDPTSGGWGVVPAGTPPGQWTAFSSTGRTLSVPQGRYDVYWLQRSDLPPLPVAPGVDVGPAGATVAVTTGVRLLAADWARLDSTAHWAATTGPQKSIVSESSADAMVLSVGTYDIYWKAGADTAFGWVRQVIISPMFGSMGLEVEAKPEGLRVVSPISGAAADRAGMRTGDMITAVDGRNVVGLELAEAVSVLRGPPSTTSNLSILRAGMPVTISVTRASQSTIDTVTVNSGIRLRLGGGQGLPAELVLPMDPQSGWWGAVPEDADINAFIPVNRSRSAGQPLPLPPGTFDLYWRQDDKTSPTLLAKGVMVETGRITETDVRR